MNRITTLLAVGILAAGAPLVPLMTTAAHAQQYGSYGGDPSVSRRPSMSFEARVQTDRTQYSRGRAVEVTMSLTNITGVTLHPFPGSSREYDFWVRDGRTNEAVYTLSKHREKRRFEPYALPSGDSRYFRELWDQRDDNGRRVEGGVYTIEARIWPQQTVSTQIYLADEDGPARPPRPRPGDPGPGHPSDNDGLKTTLRADRTRVAPGDSVSLTYTLTNMSDGPMTLTFPSGKQFDMTATTPNGQLTWQQSRGIFYTQVVTRLRLNPGEQQVFTATWQIAPNVPSGVYNVYAFLTPQSARNRAYAPASFRLAVGNAGNGGGLGNGAPGGSGNGGSYNGGFTPGAPPQGGVYDGGFTPGTPPSGGNGGLVVANPTNGPVIMNGVHLVGMREFVSPRASSYVGQRVTISGTYLGQKGGYGAPPRLRTDWIVVGDGTSIYVSGPVPANAREGANIVVIGTVCRTNDGRLYIDAR